MKSNVYSFAPAGAATAAEPEPIEAAVREISARIAESNVARRRLHARVEELRTLAPGLRRKGPRLAPPEMSAPVTFYSIEEADASGSSPLQAA